MLATRSARWTVGTALTCVMIMVAAWFALITPRREEADAVRAQAVSAQVEAQQLQVKIAQLKAQYAELPLRKAELTGILKQMPPTSQMPDLLRSLTTLSEAAGVDFVSVAPSSPTYLAVAPTAAGVAAVAAGSASGSTGTSPAAAGGTATATTGTTPASTTPSRVILTPIVVTVTGEFLQTVTYLQKLQTQAPRAFLIVGLQVSPDSTKPHQVRMVISGRVFSLPTEDNATSSAGRGTTGTAGTTGTGTGSTTTPSSGSTPAIAVGRDGAPATPPVSRIGNTDSHGQVTS